MKFERIERDKRADELPSLPIHADAAVFLPSQAPRWMPAMMVSGLIFYPLLGWAIYTLFW